MALTLHLIPLKNTKIVIVHNEETLHYKYTYFCQAGNHPYGHANCKQVKQKGYPRN